MPKELDKEDWQLISVWIQDRYSQIKPQAGEPPPSKAYKEQEDRIMGYLLDKAYPRPPKGYDLEAEAKKAMDQRKDPTAGPHPLSSDEPNGLAS